MLIVSEQGIYTAELCENSKKYLSRLLIGKTGINPVLLTWKLLLTEKLRLDHFIETGDEDLTQLQEARAEWNLALKENKLQSYIQNKLVKIETLHAQEYLKAYDPEVKKQQVDLRSKQLAWVSIAIIVGLTTTFTAPFAFGLLGSFATLMGVSCLAIGVILSSCSSIPAFFGETLIDPEWVKEFYIEKEKWQQQRTAIKATSETAVINEEMTESINNTTTASTIQQTQAMINKEATKPLRMADATTQATANNIISKAYPSYPSIAFFNLDKQTKKSTEIHIFTLSPTKKF